jgi:hypothetical protein
MIDALLGLPLAEGLGGEVAPVAPAAPVAPVAVVALAAVASAAAYSIVLNQSDGKPKYINLYTLNASNVLF